MSNRDYLYTQYMIDSGRTAELTAGERLREAADLRRDRLKDLPACCINEQRSMDGGCLNCGDPCL